jgi:outer membrane protein
VVRLLAGPFRPEAAGVKRAMRPIRAGRVVPALLICSAALSGATAGFGQAPAPRESPAPDAAAPLDLREAVARALAANPALRAIEARRGEVAAGIREAKADAYPQLAAVSSYGQSRNPSFLNSPDFEEFLRNFPGGDFEPGVQELYGAGIEVSQPLYTGGKVRAAIRLAEKVAGVTDAQIRAARLDTALAAAEAYFEVLAAKRALQVVEIQERNRRESLNVVQARYDLGEATRLELLRARSSLIEVSPDVVSLRGDIEVAESRLRVVLGLPPGAALAVAEQEGELPPLPGLPVLAAVARENRPELADLELQRQALELQQEVTRAESRPQLDFDGAYGREVRLFENFTDDLYANWRFGLFLRWELFDGGRRQAQVAQLESQRQQRSLELTDLANRIALEIEEAATRYRTAVARYQAAKASADASREATRVARDTYQEGVALQVDLLEAQQRETEAEIALVDAYYDSWVESAQLARALGQLPTEPLDGRPTRVAEGAGRDPKN